MKKINYLIALAVLGSSLAMTAQETDNIGDPGPVCCSESKTTTSSTSSPVKQSTGNSRSWSWLEILLRLMFL
jgi:hypothetical protein